MFIINPWICTNSYISAEKELYISFIEDLKHNKVYILKGNIAVLWKFIHTNKPYKIILNYAIKNNLETEFYDFISELAQNEIIKKKRYRKVTNKYLLYYIKQDTESYSYLKEKIDQIVLKYNYINILYLELNYQCNLNCVHCCNSGHDYKYQITYTKAKNIIDEAYNLGVSTVILTGGECTLNKSFLKIAQYIRKKHLKLIILTNGQYLYENKQLVAELQKIFPYRVQISLYSMKSEVHDKITKIKGSHAKTLKVIEDLKSKNINVAIAYVMLKYNQNDYNEVHEYANSINVESTCDCRIALNEENKNLYVKPSIKARENFYIEDLIISKTERVEFKKEKGYICGAGIDRLCVTPGLDILPCINFNFKLGNYNKTSLTDIKRNVLPQYKEKFLRTNLKDCFKFSYCKYCIFCPTKAEADYRLPNKSESLCEDAKIYQKAYLKLINSKEKIING